MESVSKRVVIETVDASEKHIAELETLIKNVNIAETQVQASALAAEQEIIATFRQLSDVINQLLSKRQNYLIESIKKFENEALPVLNSCKDQLLSHRDASVALVKNCNKVLDKGGFESSEQYSLFREQSSQLGALPATMDEELVPMITFQCSREPLLSCCTALVSDFGSVSRIGPLQIASLEPHPGALLVSWEDVDQTVEIDGCRLQMARYDAWCQAPGSDSCFRDVYIGDECSCFVRSLRQGEKYSFRVSCKKLGEAEWSAWSRVKSASSDLKPFTWDLSNQNYIISNDNRLSRMLSPNSVLYSDGPLIGTGNSIKLTIMNMSEPQPEEGVALCANRKDDPSFTRSGTLVVTFSGYVFVNGDPKLTKLPVLTDGKGCIELSCQQLGRKWRVNIESGMKAVTYDWDPGYLSSHLYFATLLNQNEAQVMVE